MDDHNFIHFARSIVMYINTYKIYGRFLIRVSNFFFYTQYTQFSCLKSIFWGSKKQREIKNERKYHRKEKEKERIKNRKRT